MLYEQQLEVLLHALLQQRKKCHCLNHAHLHHAAEYAVVSCWKSTETDKSEVRGEAQK